MYEDFVGNETFRRGEVIYLHIDPAGGIIGKIASSFEFLGSVSSAQPSCLWFGPHLHQSANTALDTPFFSNKYGPAMGCASDPCPVGDNFQVHTIYWDPDGANTDDDSDGYTDWDELVIGTDPSDPCADTTTRFDERGPHYNEGLSPWPVDIDDNRVVNILDLVELTPPVFGTSTGESHYRPRLDLRATGTINILDVTLFQPPVFNSSCG